MSTLEYDDKNTVRVVSTDGKSVHNLTPEQYEKHARDPAFAAIGTAPVKAAITAKITTDTAPK